MISNEIQFYISLGATILASSGFWAYVLKKCERKSVKSQMLLALGHDKILELGLKYLDRGMITTEEYENLQLLYKPYKNLGGNGTAKRLIVEIEKLEITNDIRLR